MLYSEIYEYKEIHLIDITLFILQLQLIGPVPVDFTPFEEEILEWCILNLYQREYHERLKQKVGRSLLNVEPLDIAKNVLAKIDTIETAKDMIGLLKNDFGFYESTIYVNYQNRTNLFILEFEGSIYSLKKKLNKLSLDMGEEKTSIS